MLFVTPVMWAAPFTVPQIRRVLVTVWMVRFAKPDLEAERSTMQLRRLLMEAGEDVDKDERGRVM